MILVPIKDFTNAKQRLAPVLTPAQRCELARTMFTDVLHALASVASSPRVAVVTRDAEAMRLASELGFARLYDGLNAGETEAIASATEQAVELGAVFSRGHVVIVSAPGRNRQSQPRVRAIGFPGF